MSTFIVTHGPLSVAVSDPLDVIPHRTVQLYRNQQHVIASRTLRSGGAVKLCDRNLDLHVDWVLLTGRQGVPNRSFFREDCPGTLFGFFDEVFRYELNHFGLLSRPSELYLQEGIAIVPRLPRAAPPPQLSYEILA